VPTNTPTPINHLYFLLDRSGSMASIADDVVGGFNTFLAEQAADVDDARVTLVQFDSGDPFEVVVDAKRIARVPELTTDTYVPRGSTPLLDATGGIIEHAARRQAKRAKAAKPAEEITVVTITDGFENASRAFTRDRIRQMIAAKETDGWTFVFLSADLDGYADAGALGYDQRSVQSWETTGESFAMTMSSVSRAVSDKRRHDRQGARYDKGDFFRGVKEAEAARGVADIED